LSIVAALLLRNVFSALFKARYFGFAGVVPFFSWYMVLYGRLL